MKEYIYHSKVANVIKQAGKEVEKHPLENVINRLQHLKDWLGDQPGHPTHLSNLPQWFWEDWGDCINDIKDFIKEEKGR
jgi:hypothetical protein